MGRNTIPRTQGKDFELFTLDIWVEALGDAVWATAMKSSALWEMFDIWKVAWERGSESERLEMCGVSSALGPAAETNQSGGVWAQNYGPLCSPESAIKNGLVTQRDAVFRMMLPPSAEATCFIACDLRIAAPQGHHKTLHFLILFFFLFFFSQPSEASRLCHDRRWWDGSDRMDFIHL